MKQYIKQIKTYIKENPTDTARIIVIIFFLGLALFALYLSFAYETDQWVIADVLFGRFLAHTLINIAPELAGLIIGVVTIDYLNERRQDERLKKQLILQMGSRNKDVTDTAVRILEAYGWLYDGTLENAKLQRADLEGARLNRANLKGVNLKGAKLREANLKNANLAGAILEDAILIDAVLIDADLNGAWLKNANLKGSVFSFAYELQKDFVTAKKNLEESQKWVRIMDSRKLRGVTMPDGRKYEEWQLDKEE